MMISKFPFLFVVVFGLASCSSEPASSNSSTSDAVANAENSEAVKVRPIGSQEAKTLLTEQGDMVILDVRTPKEYHSGHLQDAQHIDFYASDFSEQLQELDSDKPYMVYCAAGGRSSKAAQMMENMGFKQVYDASEGFSALKNAGIPVEEGDQQ